MFDFPLTMGVIEIFGLISGILTIVLLIKQNIWTWPIGIAYTLSSIYIFFNAKLYALYTAAELPYWDNTTSILSLLAIWLQSRKKIESWMLWLVVDILAVGIYFYKEIYFYSILYTVYIVMAFIGYFEWHKSYKHEYRNHSDDRP